jgi:hypothetical protein
VEPRRRGRERGAGQRPGPLGRRAGGGGGGVGAAALAEAVVAVRVVAVVGPNGGLGPDAGDDLRRRRRRRPGRGPLVSFFLSWHVEPRAVKPVHVARGTCCNLHCTAVCCGAIFIVLRCKVVSGRARTHAVPGLCTCPVVRSYLPRLFASVLCVSGGSGCARVLAQGRRWRERCGWWSEGQLSLWVCRLIYRIEAICAVMGGRGVSGGPRMWRMRRRGVSGGGTQLQADAANRDRI